MLRKPAQPGRPAHVSAASGLVLAGRFIYVVADDEMHLGVFDRKTVEPGTLLRVFEGALPAEPGARKKRKPDLEALCRLSPGPGIPSGALLALGSGSTSRRRRGAVVEMDPNGAVTSRIRVIDAEPMLSALRSELAVVNVEGAVAGSHELLLFNRGNRLQPENAIVRIGLDDFFGTTGGARPPAIRRIDLGSHDGVPFCFTDASALPSGGIVFTAVAEDTGDAYRDGPCLAAAIGMLDQNLEIISMEKLDRPYKIEGVAVASESASAIDLLLVTDADDPVQPSVLLSARLPR